MSQKQIIIIGSGFSALAAASYLAKSGHQVTILEKNDQIGGRARQLKKDGFTFDIGPTWYWMPDVFERLAILWIKFVMLLKLKNQEAPKL
jgi:phytoene desaturase